MALLLFLVVLAYLMGSICSAVVVCRVFSLPDPRLQGSKNPGATNVLRIAGKKYASLVLLVDILKGTIPVLIAQIFTISPFTIGCTAFAAVVGHMYPVFFQFKGGKGVATALGALLGINLFAGLLAIATWLVVARFSYYSSLASLVALSLAPLYILILEKEVTLFVPLFFMTILIFYKHGNNLGRLVDGTEPKIRIKSPLIEEIVESSPADIRVAEAVIISEKTTKKASEKKAVAPKSTAKTPTQKPKSSTKAAAVRPKKATPAPKASEP